MQSECGWEDLGDEQVMDRYAELLMPTPYTASDGELDALAREFATAPSPHDAIEATGRWMRDTLTYAVGTTEVSTSALEAWRQGSGVCQDFAHLTLALLRAMGIPSRYVSGYIHPEVDPVVGTTVSGASHAWVEAWLGDWRAFDPTNGAAVGERHITVAQGRDYADVAPLRGVYRGGALEALEVSVELTRVQ